jgi:hypothetical protein
MVEQLIRNQQVSGSIPLAGSIECKGFFGRFAEKSLFFGNGFNFYKFLLYQ